MTQAHILVVDDEPDIRELVRDILEDEGHQVTVAENGEEARTQFARSTPDLVLLDIWMAFVRSYIYRSCFYSWILLE